MIINLINSKQMFSLTLPNTIKGQYWITDIDNVGNPRQLISVEAIQGEWVVKSNRTASIIDENNQLVKSVVIKSLSFLNLKLLDSNERVILFAEELDETRKKFRKVVVKNADIFYIGRNADNDFCYTNRFVSGKHAKLSFDGSKWTIYDTGSTNGTYVNGYCVETKQLNAGDLIYIMGLKIIIGDNYFAVNNPDGLLTIRSNNMFEYRTQQVNENVEEVELPNKKYFYRSPRFYREINSEQLKIDSPPQAPKQDTTPMIMMIAPSMTMGMASVTTSVLTVSNIISGGGSVVQAIPSIVMSLSMMLGTVLWPIVTKKFEKKQRIKNEKKRQDKYLAYLETVRDQIKRTSKEQSDILFENHVSPQECVERILNESSNLWERSFGQNDFLKLRLGLGNLPLDMEVNCSEKKFTMEDDTLQDAMLYLGNEPKQLINVPITVSLLEKKIIGIYGEKKYSTELVNNIVLQIMSLHSYDDVKMMFITSEEQREQWDYVRFIPHFWNDDKTERYFATNLDEVKELSVYIEKNILSRVTERYDSEQEYLPHYIIISTDKKISEKCEALQELNKAKKECGVSIIYVSDELRNLPKETVSVIYTSSEESRVFNKGENTEYGKFFVPDSVDRNMMIMASEAISNIELDIDNRKYSLPSMVTFLEMFNVSKIEHLNIFTRWKENNPTKTLQTPVGVDAYGEQFNLDLHEKFHGPHGLVAGMTGSGKSEFIITYILSLAVNYHPDEVAFILIDYKGGGLTGAFEDAERGIKLPHLAGTITNLDGASVKRSLVSIQSELRRRQAIFNEAKSKANEGTMDIYKYQKLYRDKVVSEPVPHLFIISDEFAELKTQQPEFMEQLTSAARIGRSLGVHLILATQKPSGVVDDQIWSNSKFRVCLKVQEKADSQEMIKCPDAAELSQTGRFYLQVGFNEFFALGQSAWCGAEYVPSDEVQKTKDESIQVIDNLGRQVMSLKHEKKSLMQGDKLKQIVAIVKYLSDIAAEENVLIRPLWLEPIPSHIYIEDIEKKYGERTSGNILKPVIGEYDDPFNQKQGILTVPLSEEGNCLVYGSAGNGKATFLTTLCYSIIKNHTPEEVNLYIVDLGSETLKVFERAPHVGDIICMSDSEKLINLVKMLQKEINRRRMLFSEYGGSYLSYCKSSREKIPNVVIVLNNYEAFSEQYEELMEEFTLLTRDGVNYGIYFVVTATSTSAVRYKVQQNFKIMMTMQLNDSSDYSLIVGKTDGLVPSKYKGRGLVALDKVYEFQTAYCAEVDDIQEFIRKYCLEAKNMYQHEAKRIPVLPNIVDLEFMKNDIKELNNIPVGVIKESLAIASIDILTKVLYPIAAQGTDDTKAFVYEMYRIISTISNVTMIDYEKNNNYEEIINDIFNEMVTRNNEYKDAAMDVSVLDKYHHKIFIWYGFGHIYEKLNEELKEKFRVMIEKAEGIYRIHFILAESATSHSRYMRENWYMRHLSGREGIWMGDGITGQSALKVNKLTRDMYDDIEKGYGYLVYKNKAMRIKALGAGMEDE